VMAGAKHSFRPSTQQQPTLTQ